MARRRSSRRTRENKSLNLTWSTLFPEATGAPTLMQGVPWRIVSYRITLTAGSAFDSTQAQNVRFPFSEPICCQILINTGNTANVEGIINRRYIIQNSPRTFNIRQPFPNLWKEDEQRSQFLLTIQHIGMGPISWQPLLYYLIETHIQFKSIPFTFKSQLTFNRPPSCDWPEDDEDEQAM